MAGPGSSVSNTDDLLVGVEPDKRLVWAEVRQAILTQARVIHALMMRETLSRYGEHKMGFLWALIEPVLFVTLFVGMMSAMRSDSPGGMPLIPFMIAGIVPFTMFRNTMSEMRAAIGQNRSLLGFPQVSTFDVIIARGLLEGAVLLFVFVLMLAVAYLIGYEFRVENPLGVLGACVALWGLGCGMGFILACVTPIVPSVGQVAGLLLGRPLMVTSGLFFTAESVPEPFRSWLLYNPIMHLLELLRSYFFYEFESSHGSWFYAGSWALGLLVFGLLLHQALRRRAIVGL